MEMSELTPDEAEACLFGHLDEEVVVDVHRPERGGARSILKMSGLLRSTSATILREGGPDMPAVHEAHGSDYYLEGSDRLVRFGELRREPVPAIAAVDNGMVVVLADDLWLTISWVGTSVEGGDA